MSLNWILAIVSGVIGFAGMVLWISATETPDMDKVKNPRRFGIGMTLFLGGFFMVVVFAALAGRAE